MSYNLVIKDMLIRGNFDRVLERIGEDNWICTVFACRKKDNKGIIKDIYLIYTGLIYDLGSNKVTYKTDGVEDSGILEIEGTVQIAGISGIVGRLLKLNIWKSERDIYMVC